MRGVRIPVAYAIFLALSTVATASSPSTKQLFRPDPSGCLAADAGAFDLSVKVIPYGAHVGTMGSGLVSGFLPGDVLTLVRTSKSGQGGLRDRLSLSALVAGEPGRTSVVPAGHSWPGAIRVPPPRWALTVAATVAQTNSVPA